VSADRNICGCRHGAAECAEIGAVGVQTGDHRGLDPCSDLCVGRVVRKWGGARRITALFRARKRENRLPQTVKGRLLRLNVLRISDDEIQQFYISELRRNDELHSSELIKTAFPIAVRLMFYEPQHIADIPSFVGEMVSETGLVKPRETELLIRHAVGPGPSIDNIDPEVAGISMSFTLLRFADIIDIKGGDAESFVNDVIHDAEIDLERRGISFTRA